MHGMDTYGQAKVACEQPPAPTLARAASIARVGLIAGPGEI